MAKKSSYSGIESFRKGIEIIEYIGQQTAPVSAVDIAAALEMNTRSIMDYLATGLQMRWLRQTGDGYEPGPAVAAMHAGYVHGLKMQMSGIQNELNKLEV